ncbi:MAG: hydantoinase B/oxoprolinase family protein [Candidatus Rokubacteria bacterium]|nr:hydantoinase B/oxoprolinase family protein [Candidatus Rokubacteria bacterium]
MIPSSPRHYGDIDPILVSIIPNRMEGIAEEMAQTLMMTSRSGIFAEARDFVTGILDWEGRLIAQSRYFPGFAGALPYIIPPVREKYGDTLEEGDIVFANDPYKGNSHLPDMNVLKPVFWDGKVQFWVVCKGHMADIGGAGVAGYDPNGETIWNEGVIVPPTKLFVRGKLQEEILDLFVSQVKVPEIVRGDILCEVGGVNIGERGLHELLSRYGTERTHRHISAFLDASERAMREKIRTIPDGVYRGEKAIDDDVATENPLTIRVEVTVQGDEIEFDFSESDPNSSRYMNCTDAFTRSMATLTLFWILEHPESNHGSLRPFSFVNPKGTCVNPELPHSCVLATCNIAEAIQEAIQRALAPAVPGRIAAPSTNLVFPMITYIHPEKRRLAVNLDFFFRCNPSGGTLGYDGWEQGGPAQEMGMGRCPDPEIHELTHPVRIDRFEQQIDSAGAGQFRGGNGHCYRVQHFVGSVKAVVFGSGTKKHAVPTGFFGGHSPSPSLLTIERANGTIEELRPNRFFDVRPGDIIQLMAMGGPGYGRPLDRDPALVARDVRDGYLSVEKAERVYGVVVNERGAIDEIATADLRNREAATG